VELTCVWAITEHVRPRSDSPPRRSLDHPSSTERVHPDTTPDSLISHHISPVDRASGVPTDPAAFGLGSGPEETNVTDPGGNTAARSRLSSTDRSDTDLKRFSRHDRQMWAWITRIVSTGR
jgi:hypothetical protein